MVLDDSLGSKGIVTVNFLPKTALHCDFNARNVPERWIACSENKLMQQTAILPFYLMYLP